MAANKLLTAVPHLVNVSIFIIVSYLCSQSSSYSLFHLHPPLMVLAFGVLLNYGLTYTPIGSFTAANESIKPTVGEQASKRERVYNHVGVQILAMLAAVTGGLAIYVYKERSASAASPATHGVSWHGFLGFIAVIWLVVQFIGGMVLYGGGASFSWPVRRQIRMIHGCTGLWLMSLGIVVIVLGLLTGWYVGKVNVVVWWYSAIGIVGALFMNFSQSTVKPAPKHAMLD
jgi:uncharacterized membrane protein